MPARRVVINGVEQIDPRHTRAWRTLRDQVVNEEPLCRLVLPGCTRISTTADHKIPVTVAPELGLERSNVQGACGPCNEKRHNLPLEALRIGSGATDDHDDPGSGALSVFG